MRRRLYHGRRGYATLSGVLAALLIVSILMPVLIICAGSASKLLTHDERVQDEIAMGQLRRIFLLAYDTQISSTQIGFTYQGRQMRLSCVNGSLIVQPGTWIFLTDLDSCSFFMEDEIVYVRAMREGETSDYVLYRQPQRLYQCAVSGRVPVPFDGMRLLCAEYAAARTDLGRSAET